MIKNNAFTELNVLWETIEERAKNKKVTESYVALLLDKGIKECSKKLGEDAVETALAATRLDKEETIKESSDLLFHLFVLWKALDISPDNIIQELNKRRNRSGIEEKKQRL